MTSDIISIWAGILGFAYLVAAGICFDMAATTNRKHTSAGHVFGRHRPQPVKVSHSR